MQIRLLEHKDQSRIETIMSEYPLQFPNIIIEKYSARWSKFIDTKKDGYFIAISDYDEIIGHAGYLFNEESGLYEIVGVVVKKGFQRKGIGLALINTICNSVKKMNEEKIILYTLGHVGNEATIKFYASIGFDVVAYEKDFYRINYHRVTFAKNLTY